MFATSGCGSAVGSDRTDAVRCVDERTLVDAADLLRACVRASAYQFAEVMALHRAGEEREAMLGRKLAVADVVSSSEVRGSQETHSRPVEVLGTSHGRLFHRSRWC